MNPNNPAVSSQVAITPAMLEAVASDPKVMTKKARQIAMVQMQYIHDMLRDPNIPLGQRMSFFETTAKIGDLSLIHI